MLVDLTGAFAGAGLAGLGGGAGGGMAQGGGRVCDDYSSDFVGFLKSDRSEAKE